MEFDDWDSSRVLDSFATGTGKYRGARNESLGEEESESSSGMDDYLLNMSPIGPSPERRRDRKGLSKDVLSVKCTDSSDMITGTPSELALRLSSAMKDYIPNRKKVLETGINDQVAGMFEENGTVQPDTTYEINYKRSECPAAVAVVDERSENAEKSLEYRCPGTMDILSGRMVPCGVAPTLREIALGRRMRRTVVDAPECSPGVNTGLQRRSKMNVVENGDDKRGEYSCKKNKNNRVPMKETDNLQPIIESCCKRKKQAKQSRCVTFDR